ncbi:RING-H2 finger protein ATL56-like [Chenopodium quinoa]|uniref:RING-H2 finger protein ATL56-like n=1 Tax=Chenopodium quinoa TaxID=63459 RepID=UPI000B7895DE|nr:RING-H2 finger protein ATL56-like [Chenopodium quinoa]
MEIIISVFLLFVGIAISVIIHICIVGMAFSRGFGAEGVPIIKGTRLTLQDLKKMPCFEYSKHSVAEKGTPAAATDTAILDCAVCFDSFKLGDYCRSLPNCHYYFHVQCVDI